MKPISFALLLTLITSNSAFAIWVYNKKIDPITDAVSHVAGTRSDGGATLIVMCNEDKKLLLTITHDGWRLLPDEENPLFRTFTYRFDKLEPVTEEWDFNFSFALLENHELFAQKLIGHTTLALRPKGWSSAEIFDLVGSASKIRPVLEACNK